MTKEIYKRHRPSEFNEVSGQADAIKTLEGMIAKKAVPHTILFRGPSGCGKTTLARILRTRIGCGDDDYIELNCADVRGIDTIREIKQRIMLAPISGRCRVWMIDEAHKLTNDAQNAFLKMLEDTPKHVYFFLGTTDPAKLIAAVKTRCTEIECKALKPVAMKEAIERSIDLDEIKTSGEVIERIIEAAEGSPRKALVLLDQISSIEGDEAQLAAVKAGDSKSVAIDIAKALVNQATTWPQMAAIIKGLEEDDYEGIRYLVLAYCQSILLNGKVWPRIFYIMEAFSRNFYDTKKAGLTIACYDVITNFK